MANEDKIVFPNGRRLSEFQLSGTTTGTLEVSGTILFVNGTSFRPTVSDIKNLGNTAAWWQYAYVDGYYVYDTSTLISNVGGDLQINLPAGKKFKIVVG